MSQKRKRSIFAAIVLVICVVMLIVMFTNRRNNADEKLRAREVLDWYPVPIDSTEYSQDTVPTIYTLVGQRTLEDFTTTSGAGDLYWAVYSYLSGTPESDVDAYITAMTRDAGFTENDSVTGATWLEREYTDGVTTVVTIYLNESGYEVWVGQRGGRE